ncbi:MAG: hypothetical protein JWN86_2338 [Planctomycetota bacterium]|nr:hypothetical protein [Planctomycetota bacterium]
MPRTLTRAEKPKKSADAPSASPRTVAELLEQLDGIPATRIRLDPFPGTATEADVLRVLDQENVICELIEGTLVAKAMGYAEARLAGMLLTFLNLFLMRRNLGLAAGPDGTVKLTSGLIRIPDVSFISWEKMPGRKQPKEPIPRLALDLAVEVLSKSNSRKEMNRKLREYFASEVAVVWFLEPRKRTARVFTSPTRCTLLTEADALEGGEILPGFYLPLHELFAAVGRGPDE